jgi:vacuolar-type H+-ATPase subunit I/STV1
MKQIDTGLRNTAADYVKNNFWTITGTTAAATGLATCFGPGVALIPIICTAIASYSPTLAAFIQSPEARTVSVMKQAIKESKEKDRQRIQALINTADEDQKKKYKKLQGALDRLSIIAASVPDVPTSSTKIVEVIENINKEVKELPESKEVMDAVPTSEEIDAAVPTDKQIEDAKPTGGSRRRRLSAPTRKVKRSSSSKPKRYTRRRRE